MDKIEQAREVSSRIWNAGYVDESATIDALIEELASLKAQEPVGYAYAHQDFIGSVIGEKGQWAPDEIPLFLAAGAQPAPEQEVHDALCPALTGGKCDCTESPVTVDKAWSQFCGGIGRGPDAPYPGMIEAFETHYGQSFTDKDWRNETGIWAAAWSAASAKLAAQAGAQEQAQPVQREPCWCTTCRPITVADMRFVVCPDCGNKRCPKAHNHTNACTGSNEPGQIGSSWEHVAPVQAVVKDSLTTQEPTPLEVRLVDTLLGQAQVHTDHPMRHYDRTCPACNVQERKPLIGWEATRIDEYEIRVVSPEGEAWRLRSADANDIFNNFIFRWAEAMLTAKEQP